MTVVLKTVLIIILIFVSSSMMEFSSHIVRRNFTILHHENELYQKLPFTINIHGKH